MILPVSQTTNSEHRRESDRDQQRQQQAGGAIVARHLEPAPHDGDALGVSCFGRRLLHVRIVYLLMDCSNT